MSLNSFEHISLHFSSFDHYCVATDYKAVLSGIVYDIFTYLNSQVLYWQICKIIVRIASHAY